MQAVSHYDFSETHYSFLSCIFSIDSSNNHVFRGKNTVQAVSHYDFSETHYSFLSCIFSIDSFLRGKALCNQSHLSSIHFSFLSCSPVLYQYVVTLGSILLSGRIHQENYSQDFSAFPRMTSLLKRWICCVPREVQIV